MALVQVPVLGDRQPQAVQLVKHQVQRADRAGQDAGEAAVELEPALFQQRSGRARLSDALVGEIDVPPAGEAVFEIPLRLAVTEQDERRHQASTFSA